MADAAILGAVVLLSRTFMGSGQQGTGEYLHSTSERRQGPMQHHFAAETEEGVWNQGRGDEAYSIHYGSSQRVSLHIELQNAGISKSAKQSREWMHSNPNLVS